MTTEHERPTSLMLVHARALDGQVAELRRWYDKEHLPEVLRKYPRILTAERFDVGDESLALYRVEGPAQEVWAQIGERRDLGRSGALDYRTMTVLFPETR